MNKLIIIGNLTADPVERSVNTASGTQNVCNFSVAVNRVVHGKKSTQYFRVSCWNKQAENAMKYLHTGSKVCVTGAVAATAYINRNGKAAPVLELPAEEIEYLNSRSDSSQLAPPQPDTDTDENGFMNIPEGIDDEIPFQ